LSRAGARIDHTAVTTLTVALLICNSRTHPQQMPQQLFVLLRGVVERFNVFSRNNQHVHRRLRVDIAYHDATLILMHQIPRYVPRYDLTKQTTIV
jgi:hypothetical protein